MGQGIRMLKEASEGVANVSKIAAGPIGIASAATGALADIVGTIDTISNMRINKKLKNSQLDLMTSQKKSLDLDNEEEERKQQWNSNLRRLLYSGRR